MCTHTHLCCLARASHQHAKVGAHARICYADIVSEQMDATRLWTEEYAAKGIKTRGFECDELIYSIWDTGRESQMKRATKHINFNANAQPTYERIEIFSTDFSSTRMDGSFFSVAITTPSTAGAMPKTRNKSQASKTSDLSKHGLIHLPSHERLLHEGECG